MGNDKKKKIYEIIRLFQENRFSKETEEKIQRWLINEEDDEEKEIASSEYWESMEIYPDKSTDKALKRVNTRIGLNKKKLLNPVYYVKRIAAVLIPLLIVSGIYFYFVDRTAEIYISAAYAETKNVTLPDGSQLWLNSGSNVRYPKSFGENERTIHLEGEGYFSVKRDEQKPFIVHTSSLSVKVLGTEFNVMAYPDDEKAVATLNSGKVEVKPSEDELYIIKPDEQLIFDKNTAKVSIEKIAADGVSGWRNGELCFIDNTIGEILKTLERRFNVSFTVEQSLLQSEKSYTVKFLKNENIEQILSILSDVTGNFSYRVEGSKIDLKATR